MDYNKRGTCEFISYQHSENNDSLERTINLYVFEHSHAVFLQFIFKDESSGKLPSHTTVFIKHVPQKSDEQDTYIFFDPNAGEFHLKEDELPSFFYNHFLRYKMHNDLLFQLYPVSLQTSASTPKI
ncbi:YopT-type cysteine protease domain-containing protein [Pelagibaculum spongiae]|uniref:Peptidase C58 YopT-type domain-containing protein n=1 Tax=Pelagibaculum spongiae TaxID=2080658 RepID=A0A2V1GVE0_9GAMM|nr:YopT-type cysteine protease domain-containing protein [Pelagibaculum spongiae]PVZ70365.1 hypothetical protein DC094_07160 [Pelagibaculum spongiae]